MTTLTSPLLFPAMEETQLPPLAPREREAMRVIVFSSQKGGSGKTTLCGQLAVQAERMGDGPVAIIDTDPQGSLSDWWNARAEDTPMFIHSQVGGLVYVLKELRMMGIQLVLIDTQPSITDAIGEIIRCADLVVIPTRPSPHDLRAIGPTLDIVEAQGKPLAFAINGANQRARITGDVAVALSQHGTVAPVTIHHRTDFATSMIDGKTVMEANPDGASASEIAALWDYLKGRIGRPRPAAENDSLAAPPAMAEPDHQAEGFGKRVKAHNFGRRPPLAASAPAGG